MCIQFILPCCLPLLDLAFMLIYSFIGLSLIWIRNHTYVILLLYENWYGINTETFFSNCEGVQNCLKRTTQLQRCIQLGKRNVHKLVKVQQLSKRISAHLISHFYIKLEFLYINVTYISFQKKSPYDHGSFNGCG